MPFAQRLGIANGQILEMMVHPVVPVHCHQHALRRRSVTATRPLCIARRLSDIVLATGKGWCARPKSHQPVRTILEETIVIADSDMLKHPNADGPFVLGGGCASTSL